MATEATTATAARAAEDSSPTKVDLSLLDSWTNNNNKLPLISSPKTDLQKLTSREAIQSRLRTFLPLTYFCKPASLSPIVCARFGWINTSVDLLKCSSCKAALVVQIHPKITKQSTLVKLVKAYQTKLATAHKPTCPFRFEAELHLVSKKDVTTLTVPSHYASILPQDVWEMLEQPKPLPYVRARLHALMQLFVGPANPSDGEPPAWQLPKMELPDELLKLGMAQHQHDNTNTSSKQRRMLSKLASDPHKPYSALEEETLLTQLEDILRPHSTDDDVRAQTRTMEAWEELYEGATALALLGWEPNDGKERTDNSCVNLSCSVCLSQGTFNLQKYDSHHHLNLRHHSETETEERPSKRRRTNNTLLFDPLLSHRCHCPFVSGFPMDGARKTTPIWELVAQKLLKNNQQKVQKEDDDEDAQQVEAAGEAAINRILKLLQSGVSSRAGKKANNPF